jgi:hypothetical protein
MLAVSDVVVPLVLRSVRSYNLSAAKCDLTRLRREISGPLPLCAVYEFRKRAVSISYLVEPIF